MPVEESKKLDIFRVHKHKMSIGYNKICVSIDRFKGKKLKND